ncbi:unnamed protein product, partial [Rotaria sp. Silwood1]
MLCTPCVQKSMEEHIREKTEPRCCAGVCNYQLSKYDVSCLPLKPDMLTSLLALVITKQRPQCPRCLFYIEFQTMETYEQHVKFCNPNDMIPCEYCHCLYEIYQLDEHTAYCRNIPVHERRQAFIDFIASKLKYPFTPVQVRYYIELQRQKRRTIDPHEIVDALALVERGNYWRARAQEDVTYRAQLEEYERQLGSNVKRNEELRRRYEELMADEAFKAQNCRLCPHCKRVVQHMGGCSSMVCGRNYHGGDQQSGCGKSFTWDDTKPYIPSIDTAPDKIKNSLPRPENKHRIVHKGIRLQTVTSITAFITAKPTIVIPVNSTTTMVTSNSTKTPTASLSISVLTTTSTIRAVPTGTLAATTNSLSITSPIATTVSITDETATTILTASITDAIISMTTTEPLTTIMTFITTMSTSATTTHSTTSLPSKPGDGICATATWERVGQVVAGGNGAGSNLNQLNHPAAIVVDENQTIYISDNVNNRIIKWNVGDLSGVVVAGGSGRGDAPDQLHGPRGFVFSKNGTHYISDAENSRVQRWFRGASTGDTIIRSISAYGIALDDEESLYISDREKGEVIKLLINETVGEVIISKLNHPYLIYLDRNRSLNITDRDNHRLIKLKYGETQSSIVAGGPGGGS